DDSTVGAEHGAAVSAMAKSDCGKSDDETPAPDITLPAICATAANHGEAVSSIAKDKSTKGAEHGAAVSAIAKSDCGKDNASVESERSEERRVGKECRSRWSRER